MVRVLEVENSRGVVGLRSRDLFDVRVGHAVRREAVEQVRLDRVHPRHVTEDDYGGVLYPERLGFIGDRGAVAEEVGGGGEGKWIGVLGRRAETADDRDAL